ncbi:MAG: protein nirF [Gammaproteobacteria bacterium RIFOXYA12_FULL_61_12]|nr:MAG: protein nirF [Gammaproteobacteria bacterium RIFOXYA12_FULL_61_12]OGT90628.1 MAG: protein nirF [Gammaproteobacteria bacterium RIFOXYD12_FULL_61_37]
MAAALFWAGVLQAEGPEARATGDLGIVIEREHGSLQLIETSGNSLLAEIPGLGDLSHASAVFSRDERFAYIFGRDGGLTKVDLLERRIVARVLQSGNSIGGAISQDGSLVAVSNYTPGGVKVFDARTLEQVADIPAEYDGGKLSKVVGLVDAPGNRFVFSLWDAGEIWVADFTDKTKPAVVKYRDIGRNPYDGIITPDGRYYIAGLFGEDGLALLDLWRPEAGVKRILPDYGKGEEKLPVYKMPHLEGWAIAGNRAYLPAVGRHEVLVVDTLSWQVVQRIPVKGQPVFVVGQPSGRHVWVNFALPDNQYIQVIDTLDQKVTQTLEPGKGVLHLEFEPRGEEVWVSVRDSDQLHVYDTSSYARRTVIASMKPSGIFLTARAHRGGL